jgi:CheY-like chemotaxis protein
MINEFDQAQHSDFAKANILHLEDDPEWIEHVRRFLGNKYNYFFAMSMEEAAKLFWEMATDGLEFDLVIVDLSLVLGDAHDIQGLEFVGMLRKHNAMLGHQIIILSGYVDIDPYWRIAFRDYDVADVFDKSDFVDERERLMQLIDLIIERLRS